MKRRDFLKTGLTAVSIGSIVPTQLFAEEEGACSQARFMALEGSRMRVGSGGDWTSLELSEVRPLGDDHHYEQFELVLEGKAGLSEELYTVIPEKGSRLCFHISPAGPGRYVAVFNRQRAAGLDWPSLI